MQGVESIPTWLAGTWDISLEAAQAILSIVVILAIILPVMYFARGNRAMSIEVIMVFLAEALLVGICWLPFWLLIATVAIMAVAIALLGTRVVTGD